MYANASMFSSDSYYYGPHYNVQENYDYVFLQPNAFSTFEIESIGEFKMVKPFFINTYLEDGFYHMECEPMGIYAVGSTIEEAKEDFLNELTDAWKTYVLGDPSDFHESALKYRKWLKDNIKGPER